MIDKYRHYRRLRRNPYNTEKPNKTNLSSGYRNTLGSHDPGNRGKSMTIPDYDEHKWVEDEVRRIARQIWPEAQYKGAQIVEGLERDGVFETEDCIHLLEATVSRSKDKARDDGKKLSNLAKKLQVKNPQKAVKGWFVTKEEPTADQRQMIARYPEVVAVSFHQFQAKLVDAPLYLNLRENYAFGSVRDPVTGESKANVDYIPLDLVESATQAVWNTDAIRDGVLAGHRYVLLGDYGAGKSMTLREVYRELRKAYFKQKTTQFPVYLNLRDHFGQTNAAEVLERHARNLGFPHPAHLVRAWRAGYVILLIDGFDELTTIGIQGLWKRLQDTRFRAMQAVREFLRGQPPSAGIILAGRAHFFDSEKERRSSLGVSSAFTELTLNEFNEEQIQRYLQKKGLKGHVPAWLPSRPLLVSYLASTGILDAGIVGGNGTDSQSATLDPARGWAMILERVCSREAEIEVGIDGPTVRRILERLATIARSSSNGLGPLSRDQVIAAFSEICGYQPDEKGMILLQRLPGLGIDRADEGTRAFLDSELADVCRAGDIVQFFSDPFGMSAKIFRGAEYGMGALAVGLCGIKARDAGLSAGKLNAALRKATEADDVPVLVMDLARIILDVGFPVEVSLQLTGNFIPWLALDSGMSDCSKLRFRSCFLSYVALDSEIRPEYLPRFEECYVEELEGRSSRRDLPAGVFDDACEFAKFLDAPSTTDAIVAMDLPLGARVLLTVLKKIYLQSGSGRKENALHRGLDHHARRFVAPVLRLLQTEGLISKYRRGGLDMSIWVPDRAHTARVGRMIASPRTCNDPLIQKAATLE